MTGNLNKPVRIFANKSGVVRYGHEVEEGSLTCHSVDTEDKALTLLSRLLPLRRRAPEGFHCAEIAETGSLEELFVLGRRLDALERDLTAGSSVPGHVTPE